MAQEKTYNFPVFGTQGGGLVREIKTNKGYKYIFIEAPPEGMGLGIGDFMPEQWDIIPANKQAREAIEEDRFGNDEVDNLFDLVMREYKHHGSNAFLDKESAERLKGHPEFALTLRKLVVETINKYSITNNQFADEERPSNYTYPREYKGPKPIEEQIEAIAKIFNLNPSKALGYTKNLPDLKSFVPEDALPWVGWFAVPRLVERSFVLAKVAETRSFYNYRSGPTYRFRVHIRTASFLEQIAEMQSDSDILLVAAQLGMRHRGRSTRRAWEVFVNNEFGLDSSVGGSIALTHPERFVRWEQLHMDLPGDEFDNPDARARFDHASLLCYYIGKLKFFTRRCDYANEYYGSASGFLPQK